MTTLTTSPSRPLWKEPMLWLVFGLPLASIVAGVGLVVTAVRAGGADSVTDHVQRVAQIQTTDLGPDQLARAMDLSAIVQSHEHHVAVVPVTGDFGTGDLRLTLAHPSQAAEDRHLTLARTANGWTAEGDIEADHNWNLQLAAHDGSWRLRGRLEKDTRAARVAPSQRSD
ncbi:FixH family protein [Pseudoxanthomonas putridarboris]|uniref:FixH family protein n=1 Tax=Pseudoxanthomonas putridarboris TaxID=752605 RepID=A0ABU9J511_9GAMM